VNRLKSRGAIDDNWEETVRLYERLKETGLCREPQSDFRPDDDCEKENDGVTFMLDKHEGVIDIRDGESHWGAIGTWTSEGGFFVLCMENCKRPFHKLRSIADAVTISLDLARLPAEQRKRFHAPLRTPYACYD
jgi:hypothetical protein